MKRYIHNQYIPDITERYPQGMRDIDDYDDVPDNVTIEDALDQFRRMIDPDEIHQVEVCNQVGDCFCLAPSIDAAIKKLTESGLLKKFVSDATHKGGVIEITFDDPNWR